MCGIAGVLGRAGLRAEGEYLSAMAECMRHRGPDDGGVWTEGPIGLMHRRLSILDLSAAGHQPMVSRSGQWVIVFNGEIYNHREIRRDLAGPWRGHSDTETLLEAVSTWGVAETLERLVGMFAIALWDTQEETLYLARDRMGEKPLFVSKWDRGLAFASELKALKLLPGACRTVNRDALASYLRHNYVPEGQCIWKDALKLPPAHWMRLRSGDTPDIAKAVPYWDIQAIAADGEREPFRGSDEEAVATLDTLLRTAISAEMISDVPLGAFLSGGIDSSAVVALMQAQSRTPVRSFSIGFDEPGYDESPHAAAVARHLRTEHTELRVTAKDALRVVPELPEIWDEPFSDSSQIPTLLLSRLTRRQVTVSLSGDGGDELFAGYGRYSLTQRIWSSIKWLPSSLRAGLGSALQSVRPGILDRVAAATGMKWGGERTHMLGGVLKADTADDLYKSMISHFQDPWTLLACDRGVDIHRPACSLAELVSRMQLCDQIGYLPGDILVKVDRAAMSTSLETRVPLLDHRVVTFAWQLPLHLRFRDGQGKWILRQVLYRYVPKQLVDRPKMGFRIPLGQWLRKPMREWAEDLLSERRLREEGVFHPEPIRKAWSEHLSGTRDWQYHLWDILMYQAWQSRWKKKDS